MSIKYSDFSQNIISQKKGAAFEDLNLAFNEVINEFQKARFEKEEQYRYLQAMVQHIGLGILSFDKSGKVDLINNSAKKLLGFYHLKNLSKIKEQSDQLYQALTNEKYGSHQLVKITVEDEELTLAINSTKFRIGNQDITLVSMHNISSELAEQEMESWQKLIRVLTHEIMNSITPISSLASTVNNLLSDVRKSEDGELSVIENETCQDVKDATVTIERRSKGLLRFVDAYRNLTRIPKPDFKITSVSELLHQVVHLLNEQLTKENIETKIKIEPENLELTADPELIEQVLINLLLNAIQASTTIDKKEIALHSYINRQSRIVISVTDFGVGIKDDALDKIFTPFFTTKRDGSGIGLSLSRQIMRLHKGNITVTSEPGKKTTFRLRF